MQTRRNHDPSTAKQTIDLYNVPLPVTALSRFLRDPHRAEILKLLRDYSQARLDAVQLQLSTGVVSTSVEFCGDTLVLPRIRTDNSRPRAV